MRETHQTAQLLANMAALHRNKLLIVNSGILTGKRIVVRGWPVVLIGIKNIFSTHITNSVLWTHSSNFPSLWNILLKKKPSLSLGQAVWIDWLMWHGVKVWPPQPNVGNSGRSSILQTSHRTGWSLYRACIRIQILLLPNMASFLFSP